MEQSPQQPQASKKSQRKKAFSNLFDLAYKRSTPQAFAFYAVYLVIGLFVAFVIPLLFGPGVSGQELDSLTAEARVIGEVPNTIEAMRQQTLFLSKMVSLTFSALLCIFIAFKKGIIEKYNVVFIICGSAITGLYLGLPISVAFAAWLTTRDSLDTESA